MQYLRNILQWVQPQYQFSIIFNFQSVPDFYNKIKKIRLFIVHAKIILSLTHICLLSAHYVTLN